MKFKRRIAIFTAGLSIMSSMSAAVVSAAENLNLCNGNISISGKVNTGRAGDVVTVMVFKGNENWSDKEVWLSENADSIVYVKEATLDNERGYNFDFYIGDNGVYTAVVGSDEFDVLRKESVTYINKDKNEAVLAELKAASDVEDTDKIKDILSSGTKREEIGLFGDFYTDIDYTEASKILIKDLKGKTLTCEEAISIIDKGCVAAKVNKDKNVKVDEISDYLHLDDTLKKYYRKDFSDALLKELKKKTYTTTSQFEDSLRDGIILCTVNFADGTGDIKNILNDYAEVYSVSKSKITDGLAQKLAQNAPFENLNSVLDYISKYKPTGGTGSGSSGSGSGGSGGSGSSGSGSGGYLTGAEIPVYNTDDIKTADVFDDLEEASWAKEAITELYYKGIVNGVTEREFKPNDNVKREEFAKLLTAAFKMDLVSTKQYFEDITEDDWCYNYVNSLYLAGVTTGQGDGTFGKGLDITRQDICVMVCRMVEVAKAGFKNQDKDFDESVITDYDKIADYAKDSVKKLYNAGILSGYDDGSFNPEGFATRGEAAKIIYKTLTDIVY